MRIDKVDTTGGARPDSRVLADGSSQGQAGREALQNSHRGGVSKKAVQEHVDQLNQTLRTFDKRFAFRVHEGTNRVIVTVLDVETEEVLREIPPEKILDIVAQIDQMVGIIIDERI